MGALAAAAAIALTGLQPAHADESRNDRELQWPSRYSRAMFEAIDLSTANPVVGGPITISGTGCYESSRPTARNDVAIGFIRAGGEGAEDVVWADTVGPNGDWSHTMAVPSYLQGQFEVWGLCFIGTDESASFLFGPAYFTARNPLTLLSAPGTAKVGQAVNVRTLQVPGKAVSTQVLVSGQWRTSQTRNPDANGSVTIPLTYGQTSAGTLTWRFASDGKVSPAYKLNRLATTVSLLSAPNSAKVGAAVNVRAKVANTAAGQNVSAQFLVNGKWSTSQTRKTDSSGTVTIPLTYGQTKAGSYSWRLVSTNPYGVTSVTPAYTLKRTAATAAKPSTTTAAKPAPKPAAVVVYKNCTELNKVYPHGVAKLGGKDLVSGKLRSPQPKFVVNTPVYNANIARDADKDGVACEKP